MGPFGEASSASEKHFEEFRWNSPRRPGRRQGWYIQLRAPTNEKDAWVPLYGHFWVQSCVLLANTSKTRPRFNNRHLSTAASRAFHPPVGAESGVPFLCLRHPHCRTHSSLVLPPSGMFGGPRHWNGLNCSWIPALLSLSFVFWLRELYNGLG